MILSFHRIGNNYRQHLLLTEVSFFHFQELNSDVKTLDRLFMISVVEFDTESNTELSCETQSNPMLNHRSCQAGDIVLLDGAIQSYDFFCVSPTF